MLHIGSDVPYLKHPSGSAQPSRDHALRPAQVVCVHSVHNNTIKSSSCGKLNEHVTEKKERTEHKHVLDQKFWILQVRGLVLNRGDIPGLFQIPCLLFLTSKATTISDSGSMVLYTYHHACIMTHDIHTCAV